MKTVMRFGTKGKLSPRYVGPFDILETISPLADRIALPPSLERIHNVFYVSTLRKFVYDPSHIVELEHPSHIVELEPLHLEENLNYEELPLRIVDKMDKVL